MEVSNVSTQISRAGNWSLRFLQHRQGEATSLKASIWTEFKHGPLSLINNWEINSAFYTLGKKGLPTLVLRWQSQAMINTVSSAGSKAVRAILPAYSVGGFLSSGDFD
jgi:hypothetical protein